MNLPYHVVECIDPEFRWNENGYRRNECPHPDPHVIHEAIQREIEKERIREEIITSEILKRRVLEAEVRMELMMEREMAMRQTGSGFPFGSSPLMGPESPTRPSLLVPKAGWSAEERLGMTLEDKEKLKRIDNGRLETLLFHRGAADLRISEIKPASEGNKEKEIILLLTKPNENISGSKVKDVTPPEAVNIELRAANEISKEEWSCALCRIMATSEKDLNGHVLGKKHKSKVAALRAQRTGKNYSIGLFTKKPTKSIHVEEKGVKHKAQSLSAHKGGKAATSKKKDDLPLSQNPKSEDLKKNQAQVIRKVQKKENDPRKNGCKFSEVTNARKVGNIELPADVSANKKSKEEWRCALCQVIATSENDLNKHVLGNKHKSKVAALRAQGTGENRSMGLSPKKSIKSIHVGEKGGKTTSKKDGLPLSGNPKSEHLKSEVIKKVQKNEKDPRSMASKVINAHKVGNIELPADVIANKKSKEEWSCALCQVSAPCQKGLKDHMLGKKHKSKEAAVRLRSP